MICPPKVSNFWGAYQNSVRLFIFTIYFANSHYYWSVVYQISHRMNDFFVYTGFIMLNFHDFEALFFNSKV